MLLGPVPAGPRAAAATSDVSSGNSGELRERFLLLECKKLTLALKDQIFILDLWRNISPRKDISENIFHSTVAIFIAL